MKKIIASILVSTMLISLFAGCGSKAPVETTDNGSVNITEDAQPADDTEQLEETAPAGEVTEYDFDTRWIDEDTCEVRACYSDAEVITVPDVIEGRKVVGISRSAFAKKETAIKIILPDSVEYVDNGAFIDCINLKEVVFGSGLKWVGTIFTTCPALEKAEFPEGLEEIKGISFINCDTLTEVYVPASVVTITKGIADAKSCPNIVIVTPAGSAAEASAQESGLTVQNP